MSAAFSILYVGMLPGNGSDIVYVGSEWSELHGGGEGKGQMLGFLCHH